MSTKEHTYRIEVFGASIANGARPAHKIRAATILRDGAMVEFRNAQDEIVAMFLNPTAIVRVNNEHDNS